MYPKPPLMVEPKKVGHLRASLKIIRTSYSAKIIPIVFLYHKKFPMSIHLISGLNFWGVSLYYAWYLGVGE